MLRGKSPCLWAESVTGDRKVLAMVLAARLHAEPWCWLGPVAAAKACRERLLEAPTERGSLSSCPLLCLTWKLDLDCLVQEGDDVRWLVLEDKW
eukprot:CAMPEP_0197639026 /NCGR_PEP_ID=MMETSP1338-20131121/13773_1 /TAXON_ID=43686 ORGANISM="Pelagodinium beii, Strain RCC1491" /NCGR_SAMPLE_ID=MMETSP1338 /ASSEMBLY_ACC=CAM_ASM_000754 /LENGTH=93 /DNA_ID=CAMNT_0043211697 /DNA_START=206 /DNA_END=488 /DNA_ORIENTATION=+